MIEGITILPPYHDEYWQKIRPRVLHDLTTNRNDTVQTVEKYALSVLFILFVSSLTLNSIQHYYSVLLPTYAHYLAPGLSGVVCLFLLYRNYSHGIEAITCPHRTYSYPRVSAFIKENKIRRFSIVHMAAHNGDTELLRKLFEQDNFFADVSSLHNPFYFAAIGGHKKTLDVLTEYGKISLISARNIAFMKENQGNRQWEPLHLAAAYGHVEAIEALARIGENIESFSEYYEGMTPLMVAMSFGNIDAVKTLLRLGANIEYTISYDSLTNLWSRDFDYRELCGRIYWILMIMGEMFNHRPAISRLPSMSGNTAQMDMVRNTFTLKTELLKVVLASRQMFAAIQRNVFTLEDLQGASCSDIAKTIKARYPNTPFESKLALVKEVYNFYCKTRKVSLMGPLKTLSAMSVLRHQIPYQQEILPEDIKQYLHEDFFTTSVERIAAEITEEDEIVAFSS